MDPTSRYVSRFEDKWRDCDLRFAFDGSSSLFMSVLQVSAVLHHM
jgi:hypothetical protein